MSSNTQVTNPADWRPDPTKRHELRYHDGTAWTDHVSDKGTQSTDPFEGDDVKRPSFKENMAASKAKQTAKLEAKQAAAAAKPEALAKAAAFRESGALLEVQSHEEGRNSTVTLFPDRIERVKAKAFGSFSKAHQDAEVIPVKSISSVQAKKDGLAFTKVIAYTSGNTIEFRIPHAAAQQFKTALTELVIGHSTSTPTAAPQRDLATELRGLAALRDDGILSEAEFAEQKARLLGTS